VGELIAFNNCSTDADAYSWNFGDGSATTSEVSPSHAYTAAGQYSVVLKAWNKNNEREANKIITITGGNTTQPVACFTPSTTSAEVGVSISFNNCSADATNFSWNFGDGSSTSTQQSPSHSYTSAGTYDVVLTAYNGDLSDTETKSITITNVNNTDPVACFSIDPTTANVNQYIYTTNCSQNATSYEWDLENNGTVESTDESPVIYYRATGTYTIKLTAINGSKRNSITHTVTIVDQPIDPTVYDMPVNWDAHYVDEYTEVDSDWPMGTGEGYEASISGGYYTVTNTLTDTYWTFTTGAAAMPSASSNFDFEMYFSITSDPSEYGDGLVWGKDPNAFNYDFIRFKYGTGVGNYVIGDLNTGTWNYWTGDYWQEGGNSSGYNRLTIRKYDNKYYFL
jgi:PKD repeat protein